MRTYQFNAEQILPQPREKVFPFFADPRNLERITPPWLNFSIISTDFNMRAGLILDYRLKLHGIPLRWQSEITVYDPPNRFVDEQRRGPYRLWRHEHIFIPHGQHTRMLDNVTYAFWGSWLLHSLWVRRDLEKIFSYRRKVIAELLTGTGMPQPLDTAKSSGSTGPAPQNG